VIRELLPQEAGPAFVATVNETKRLGCGRLPLDSGVRIKRAAAHRSAHYTGL
jgi:hypothetical protein